MTEPCRRWKQPVIEVVESPYAHASGNRSAIFLSLLNHCSLPHTHVVSPHYLAPCLNSLEPLNLLSAVKLHLTGSSYGSHRFVHSVPSPFAGFASLYHNKCIITKINHAYLIYCPFGLLSSLSVLIIFHYLQLLLLLSLFQPRCFQPSCSAA